MTGPYAYKVKKPVDFGFLDYSTLERRRRFCELEVELNQRLCPDVYLRVVPVVERDGRLRVGGRGGIEGVPAPVTCRREVAVDEGAVEWAVQMRQLPETEMLPARLAAGTVTTEQVERIAAVLAGFHTGAAASEAITRFGSPAAIARNLDENHFQTESFVGPVLPAEHRAAIYEWSCDFLEREAALFRRRIAEERIRDGHGDLRAQNICLDPGRQRAQRGGGGVQIFDCIEFNDRFRCGDVAADLAYLAMDLDLAGRADLRAALVRRYAELTGDAELGRVLPFYKCYRAFVRGKIALLAADEPEVPQPQRAAERETAAAAFDLSRSYAQLPEGPLLVLTMGLSGSGKSALARALARRLPGVHLSSDSIRKELAGAAPSSRLPMEAYSSERMAAVYTELHRRAGEWLRRGERVILDATYLEPRERRAAEALARAHGAGFRILECRCPEAVALQRLASRSGAGTDASDAGVAVRSAQHERLVPLEASLRPAAAALKGARVGTRMRIDTVRPPAELARTILGSFWSEETGFASGPGRNTRGVNSGGDRTGSWRTAFQEVQ